MKKFCDLHTHSYYSDGTYSPSEIIHEAVSLGLSAVALCDHNTTRGLSEFMSAADGTDITAIRGIELTSEYKGRELHILGLFIPEDNIPLMQEFADRFEIRKEKSNIELARALNDDGYKIDYAEMRSKNPKGYINRAHFAAELTRLGYTESIREAFRTLLNPSNKYYTPPIRPDSLDVIAFTSQIGAVPVLAHPFLSMNEALLLEFLPQAKEHGLVGMETLYSKYSPDETARATKIATEFQLKQSGGSDFHGGRKPDINLGTGKGDLRVPLEFAESLNGGSNRIN